VWLGDSITQAIGLQGSSRADGMVVTLLLGHQYRHGELKAFRGTLVEACVPRVPFLPLRVLRDTAAAGVAPAVLRMMSYNIWNINGHDHGT